MLLVSVVNGQGAVDPKALIGTWKGGWTYDIPAWEKVSGAYELIITGFDGGSIVGRIYRAGTRGRDQRTTIPEAKTDIRGKLEGNKLTFGSGRLLTEVTVDGDRMEGTIAGAAVGNPHKVTLKKE
jgi:hypothetical protein